jgi:hypothetical protein
MQGGDVNRKLGNDLIALLQTHNIKVTATVSLYKGSCQVSGCQRKGCIQKGLDKRK